MPKKRQISRRQPAGFAQQAQAIESQAMRYLSRFQHPDSALPIERSVAEVVSRLILFCRIERPNRAPSSFVESCCGLALRPWLKSTSWMHPWQKLNASSAHQLVIVDGRTHPCPVGIFKPVCPSPLGGWVVNQLEKMTGHCHTGANGARLSVVTARRQKSGRLDRLRDDL